MEQELTLVRIGRSARLERLLPQALAGIRVKELSPEQIASAAGRRLLFAAALDEYGPDETFFGDNMFIADKMLSLYNRCSLFSALIMQKSF